MQYELFHLKSGSSKPLQVKVVVNGKELAMEIDTGASVSLLSEDTFNRLWQGAKLQKSAIKLQTYTGELIKVAGSTQAEVEHNGQVANLPLIVIQGEGPSLLGRDWMSALKLNWHEIFNVKTSHSLQSVQRYLQG